MLTLYLALCVLALALVQGQDVCFDIENCQECADAGCVYCTEPGDEEGGGGTGGPNVPPPVTPPPTQSPTSFVTSPPPPFVAPPPPSSVAPPSPSPPPPGSKRWAPVRVAAKRAVRSVFAAQSVPRCRPAGTALPCLSSGAGVVQPGGQCTAANIPSALGSGGQGNNDPNQQVGDVVNPGDDSTAIGVGVGVGVFCLILLLGGLLLLLTRRSDERPGTELAATHRSTRSLGTWEQQSGRARSSSRGHSQRGVQSGANGHRRRSRAGSRQYQNSPVFSTDSNYGDYSSLSKAGEGTTGIYMAPQSVAGSATAYQSPSEYLPAPSQRDASDSTYGHLSLN